MKRSITLTKSLIAVISLTFILSSCSSWHYKHSRVSVDREKGVSLPLETTGSMEFATIPTKNKIELTTTGHTNVSPVKSEKGGQINNPIKKGSTTKDNSGKNKSWTNHFTDNIKKIGKAFEKPQTEEKAALSGWVRIMIILFVVGFILLLVGIFLSAFIYGGFWWLFYTFGALCILAGLIVMILGLVGLI